MVLSFYTFPTLFSASYYGRRHAVFTAIASVLVVILVVRFNPFLLANYDHFRIAGKMWFDIAVWGVS